MKVPQETSLYRPPTPRHRGPMSRCRAKYATNPTWNLRVIVMFAAIAMEVLFCHTVVSDQDGKVQFSHTSRSCSSSNSASDFEIEAGSQEAECHKVRNDNTGPTTRPRS